MSTYSAPSARSLQSPNSNGHATIDQLQHTAGFTPASFSGPYQKSLASAKLPNDSLNLSPDELFTKHTVSEVKAVQQRLRADAEAKQEELRLMVGSVVPRPPERYRDLLQASSSIISIASSSQRVLEALQECNEAIVSQHALPAPPKTAAIDGLDDRHLSTLQVLSAHMKLLLDAPEHLWRLIERKKYFQAAWLFLLTRVVHRALVRNDDNDEQSWVTEGVDVLTEFPLVQRQWDVVSQFQSQIIHKSTLSLREASASTEETCATLVTLHLLDSRPLNETLAALLLQRSKTLQSLLSWTPSSNGNNHLLIPSPPVPVREVTQVMKNALNTMFQTIGTARTIFHSEGSRRSLVICVLESIQADSESDLQPNRLPDELSLSTQSLLTQLTSSANFQLLPPGLRSYKPYIDLTSSSTSLSQSEFSQKLQEWFNNASEQWRQAAEKWFSGLQSVKDVWSLRVSTKRCIIGSELKERENNHVMSNLDSLCHKRIIAIWQRTLLDTELNCKNRLRENVFTLRSEGTTDNSPVDFLFQPPPIPILPQTVKSFVDTPFQKYQLSLKRQLVCRSSQLDSVISSLEQCARTIQHDFYHLKAGGDEKTVPLLQRLKETYEPNATALSIKVVSFMDEVAIEAIDSPDSDTNGLAFLCRTAADLAYSSLFIQNIGCSHESAKDFKQKMVSINDKVLRKWKEITVDRIIQECRPRLQKRPLQTTGGPSSHILQALLSICDSVRQLGVFHHPARQNSIAQELLRSFIMSWFAKGDAGEHSMQDIAFLQKLSDQYGPPWADASDLLAGKLKTSVCDDVTLSGLGKTASEYLARTQTLLSSLLPPPPAPTLDAPLLQFGIPSLGQNHDSAVDLAKPSPRFGMLLVGNADR
ncbi:hypothetical protein GALMADRAFT_132149 [Galerina marginata CBS 339.88]|uniref:Conserved oligomeric Golgi complex subunit 1 n=1 Tax=Galerina marginata (strain CBS 339.88) TaxID=685588 RepID=A0A067TQK1_GALM3|nr:hypothetical protein GALMADRAFT_132149 [Galerina marginata CBS 339.88]